MNRCLVVNHSIHLYTHTNHTHPPILTQIFQAVCERAELRHILEAVRHLAPDALHSVEQKLGRELHSVLHPPPQSHSLQNPAHPPVSTNQIQSSQQQVHQQPQQQPQVQQQGRVQQSTPQQASSLSPRSTHPPSLPQGALSCFDPALSLPLTQHATTSPILAPHSSSPRPTSNPHPGRPHVVVARPTSARPFAPSATSSPQPPRTFSVAGPRHSYHTSTSQGSGALQAMRLSKDSARARPGFALSRSSTNPLPTALSSGEQSVIEVQQRDQRQHQQHIRGQQGVPKEAASSCSTRHAEVDSKSFPPPSTQAVAGFKATPSKRPSSGENSSFPLMLHMNK